MEEQGQYLTSFQRKLLLKSLEDNLRPEYRRRIEIMLLADEGQSQAQICITLGCSQETARHWMVMAQTGQAHHWSDRPMGRPKAINDQYLARLRELVSSSPREHGYPFKRWTGLWLSKHLAKELEIEISACHVNRLLKQMGLSTRPKRSEETPHQNDADSKLKIRDLKSASAPEFTEQWSFISSIH